ncbi:MAG: hypothetical protein J7L16_06900 [Deltaproteobacteria bacterium]|nr:hypothetical protein [Deltaproteobacteria bacterium]
MKQIFVVVLASLFIAVLNNYASAFDFASFDPAGDLLEHLKETVPDLEIHGFFKNRTDLDLHGKDDDVGLGHINKTWECQMIEWDASIEFRYRISDHLELINEDHFLYDSMYDWDHGADFPDDVEDRLKYYNSTKQILRELYVNITYGNWFFKLGKQQVVWGKMDGKCIDVINPGDYRESVNMGQDDYEWRRIPLWMSNITYFWSDYYFQFIWIPDFEPSQSPQRGSVWWYPSLSASMPHSINKKDKPSTAFKDNEFAFRFNMVKNGWDTSFIYFYTWDDFPTLFKKANGFDPLTGDPEYSYDQEHTRLHQFGFNIDKGNWFLNRNWVWRVEFLYTLNDYISTADTSKSKGVVKRNCLKSISSIETSWMHGEISTLFQFAWKYQPGYDSSFKSLGCRMKRFDPTLSLSVSKQWYNDRLKLTTIFYSRPGEGSWKFKDTISWTFSDYVSAQIRYTGYSGPDDDIYGMYSKWDNLGVEFTYRF